MTQEYANLPKLFHHLSMQNTYISENQVAQVAQQLLTVLSHAQKYNISHRRLDSECLFLQRLDSRKNTIQIKVGGFERASLDNMSGNNSSLRESKESNVYAMQIRPQAISVSSSKKDKDTNVRDDLIAVGIIIYVLLSGTAPFKCKQQAKIAQEAAIGYISFLDPIWKKICPEAVNFVKRLVQRPKVTPNAIEACLKDPWLLQVSKNTSEVKMISMDALNNLRKFNLQIQLEILGNLIRRERDAMNHLESFRIECYNRIKGLTSSSSNNVKSYDSSMQSSNESQEEERKTYKDGENISIKVLRSVLSNYYRSQERALVECNELQYQLNWYDEEKWRLITGKHFRVTLCRRD